MQIGDAAKITSANTKSFTYLAPDSFTVTTTGVPTPMLSESGALPGGVTFTDNGDGTATLAGTPGAAGTFPLVITAHNGFGPDDTQNFSLVVNKANQTITFGALVDKTYGDPDFNVSATSDSGLAVSFAASGTCTVSGSTVHITGAGSCTITASQAGNSNYNAATDVPQTFTIAKADPIVTATGGTFTYDGSPHAGSGTATGVKGESLTPVNVAYKDSIGNLLTSAPVNAGTYSVAARFAGDNNYNQKQSAAVPLIINKATPTVAVSFTASPITYDGNPHAATVVVTGVNSTVLTASDGTVAITYTPGGSQRSSECWELHGFSELHFFEPQLQRCQLDA